MLQEQFLMMEIYALSKEKIGLFFFHKCIIQFNVYYVHVRETDDRGIVVGVFLHNKMSILVML